MKKKILTFATMIAVVFGISITSLANTWEYQDWNGTEVYGYFDLFTDDDMPSWYEDDMYVVDTRAVADTNVYSAICQTSGARMVSDSEIVCYYEHLSNWESLGWNDKVGSLHFGSLTGMKVCGKRGHSDKYNESDVVDVIYSWDNPCVVSPKDFVNFTFASGQFFYETPKCKMFDSEENALTYLETGVINGLIQDGSKEYNSDELYLNNFDMIVHESSVYDNYYIELIYEPSDILIKNGGVINITTDVTVSCSNALDITGNNIYDENINGLSFSINLSENPYGCILYLDDLISFDNAFDNLFDGGVKSKLLGREGIFDLVNIPFIEASGIVHVDYSYITMTCVPSVSNTYGSRYDIKLDLLNTQYTYTSSYNTDTQGNYTSNNDLKQIDGYYYQNIQTDSSTGDVTTNNYYYGSDGTVDVIVNTGSGGSINGGELTHSGNITHSGTVDINVGGNVDVSGTIDSINGEYSDEKGYKNIWSAILNGFGLFDKDSSVYAFFSAITGTLPGDIVVIITTGIAVLVVVSVFRILRG